MSKKMTVGELVEILSGLDPDMEVMGFEGAGLWSAKVLGSKLDVYEVVQFAGSNLYSMDVADVYRYPKLRKLVLGIG